MKNLYYFGLILSITIINASCKKDNDYLADIYRLDRVEYYDTNGVYNNGFKNLSYDGDMLTRIDMISLYSQVLEYENRKVVTIKDMLGAMPFPINTYELKYSTSGQLEKVVSSANGAFGQNTQGGASTYLWSGSKLVEVTTRETESSGKLIFEEKLKYTYSGNNITKCVFAGSYHAFTAGPVHWKDSVEFQYDASPNKFSENGIPFFFHEFSFIYRFLDRPLRIQHIPYNYDPFNFDAAFFAFIQSENNVVTMKSRGGSYILHFDYIMGSGVLSEKVQEIKINDKVASRYFYKR